MLPEREGGQLSREVKDRGEDAGRGVEQRGSQEGRPASSDVRYMEKGCRRVLKG